MAQEFSYRVCIESESGKLLHDFPPSRSPSAAITAAYNKMHGVSGCKRKWNGDEIRRFFPVRTKVIQSELVASLGLDSVQYEALSHAALREKVHRLLHGGASGEVQGLSLSSLAEMKVMVMRKDNEGNVIKTAKTGKPSCMKVTLEKYLGGRGSKDLVLVERERDWSLELNGCGQ